MSEHISKQEGERYRNRTMASDELFATSFHLAICDACYQQFGGNDVLDPTYTFIREELKAAQDEEVEHTSYDQIAAYVDQKLSWADREVVESHFEICAECNATADKLRLLKTATSLRSARAHTTFGTWMDRLRLPAWRIPIWVAAAAVAVVLLIWLVTAPLRTHEATLQREAELLRQTNEKLNQEIANLQSREAQVEEYRRESERLTRDNEAHQATINRLEKELAQKQAGSPINRSFSAQPVVALTDGSGPVLLDEQGNLKGINSLPVSYQRLIKTALTTGQIQTSPLLAKLRGKTSQTMGQARSPIPFSLLVPKCAVIESDRPSFRWQPLTGATGYTVTLLDSRLNRVAGSPVLQTNDWQIPSPLKRGGIYYWQVKALKDGQEIVSPSGPAPDVRFQVLAQAKVNELEKAKKELTNSHLTLGVIYAQMGLIDEAIREIEALARANPSSELVQRMLHSLQNLKC